MESIDYDYSKMSARHSVWAQTCEVIRPESKKHISLLCKAKCNLSLINNDKFDY